MLQNPSKPMDIEAFAFDRDTSILAITRPSPDQMPTTALRESIENLLWRAFDPHQAASERVAVPFKSLIVSTAHATSI